MPAERFPAIELVPKRETQLLDFLASNEKSDGCGIVIAVLDQGKMFISKFSLQITVVNSSFHKGFEHAIRTDKFCDSGQITENIIIL